MPSSYLFINNLRFHYLYWNLEGVGRPVLLLHGLAANARIWERVAERLAAAGLVALAPDLRGHGLTDKPAGDYGFDTYRRDLLAFIDTLALERPLLVGHAWGGMVALDYAGKYTGGPRSPAGLFFVDGGFTRLVDLPGATWDDSLSRLAPPRQDGAPLEHLLADLAAGEHAWRPDDGALQILLSNYAIAEDETVWPRLSFDHQQQILRAIWDFPTHARLEQLRCLAAACLAIPPEPPTPAEAEFLVLKRLAVDQAQSIIPSLQVHWLPDSLHVLPLHRPDELARLIVAFNDQLGSSS